MADNSAEKELLTGSTQVGNPIHRVKSAQLVGSPKEPSLSRSGSAGSLQAKAESSPRRSAPGSAKSDQLNKRRPLPPIGTSKEDLAGEDEFASVTESELAVDRNITELESSDDDAAEKKQIRKVSPILEVNAESSISAQKCSDMETQTEWSWIETMKIIQQQQVQAAKLQALADETEDGETESQKAGRGSTHSKGSKISKAGTLMSQSSRRKSGFNLIKPEDEIQRSITGTVLDEPNEILTTLVLPYREDEYGIPALQFSDSDSESDDDEATKPARNMTKTLPSVGPPQILQYKRDTKKGIITQSEPISETDVTQTIDETDSSGQELITFSGNCEFCNELIKPFPTLHQQQICPPEELYCCEEFANFVRLAILPPPPNSHLIDIKPHGHYGTKQARAAAKEKAELRIREREVQRARTLQSSHSSGPSGVHPASHHATGGGEGRSHGAGGGGANHHASNHPSNHGGGGGNLGGASRPDAGGANMFALKSLDDLMKDLFDLGVFDNEPQIIEHYRTQIKPNPSFYGTINLANSATSATNFNKKQGRMSKTVSRPVLPKINQQSRVVTTSHSKKSQFGQHALKPIRHRQDSIVKLRHRKSKSFHVSEKKFIKVKSSTSETATNRYSKRSSRPPARGSRLPNISTSSIKEHEHEDSLTDILLKLKLKIDEQQDPKHARAMKTINFQLSSQKCIDEGYVIRPPSPLREEEYLSEPFLIEPVEWCHVKLNDDEEDQCDVYSYVDENGRHIQFTKPRPKRACVERFYPDGRKFLTMFPDGTGNVFYPNEQLAISVSSIEPGKFTYLVYDVQNDDRKQQELLAEFEPDAKSTCYHRGGVIRLYLDQMGGIELAPTGHKKKKWHWLADQDAQHVHAPPVQPLCFALNRYVGMRVVNQDNIAMTFLGSQRSCRFNVGVRLKLVHPENLPVHFQFDDDELFMKEKSNHISGLIDKIETLLKFPHSTKAERIPVPKRVTIKAERIERQRVQAHIARQKDKERRTKKFSRPLPSESNNFEHVLMTEPTDIPLTQRDSRGRPPKHPVVVVN